jgi:REP element-mobilizing transposase RayT
VVLGYALMDGIAIGAAAAMESGEPLAFFITWTVYGSYLQGDERGWRRRREGIQSPQPRLAEWRRERLKHDVIFLSPEERKVVAIECRRHCDHRGWHLWEVNARSNHVHVVVTAVGYSGKIVRDQLKANCTRGLRQQSERYCNRAVWTVGGDWESVNSDDDLEAVCLYVREAQDQIGNSD